MALTPNSGGSSFLDPAGFLDLYDVRPVGELTVDDDSPPAQAADLTADPSLSPPARVLLRALQTASGRVESAAVRGGRYAASDLANLNGNSLAYLQSIVAAIAYETLRRRRGGVGYEPMPEYQGALDEMARLESGEDVLSFAETEQAGLPRPVMLTPRDIFNLHLASGHTRMFGIRGHTRFPGGPGPYPYGCD